MIMQAVSKGIALAVLLLGVCGAAEAAVPPALAPETLCQAETAKAEGQYGIPHNLMDAISIVESGRYNADRRATLAWPWTINAEGQGKFFATKAEAIAEVQKLKARGVKIIDVGCMQVNLFWHPQAFANLDEAFDPAANVAYAARFVKGLFEATGHWPTAASYYHSQTPSLAAEYRARLMKVWSGGGSEAALAMAPEPREPRVGRDSSSSGQRRQLATARPVEPGATLRPLPQSPAVEQMRQAYREQTQAARDEARAIAAAYRQARLAEYQLRRASFSDSRRVANRY